MNRFKSTAVVFLIVSAVLAAGITSAAAAPKAAKAQRRAVVGPGGGVAVQNRRGVVTPGGSVVKQSRSAVKTPGGKVAVKKSAKVGVKAGPRRVVRVAPRYVGPRTAFVVGRGIWLGFRIAAAPYYYDYPVFERYPMEVAVQIELQREGYYRGPIDGIIGRGSQQAIAEYQADHGMRPTGEIDRELLDDLDIVD